MIFSKNSETETIEIEIQNGDVTKRYVCSFNSCDNPVCTCGSVHLQLFPVEQEYPEDPGFFRSVAIDILQKKLDYEDENEIHEEQLRFANAFISSMDNSDFQFLWNEFFAYKNRLTEKATVDSLDTLFDYEEVEKNGLMSTYNDVLPYGDYLMVSINGQNCIVYDQYCLLSACPCSDAHLSVFLADEYNIPGEELYSVSVDYMRKKWGKPEEGTETVNVKTLRSALEEQIPDIYKRLYNRHMKLKSIYSHSKKRHYKHVPEVHSSQVGRNDPCPCGSGKKYKKCCLRD